MDWKEQQWLTSIWLFFSVGDGGHTPSFPDTWQATVERETRSQLGMATEKQMQGAFVHLYELLNQMNERVVKVNREEGLESVCLHAEKYK